MSGLPTAELRADAAKAVRAEDLDMAFVELGLKWRMVGYSRAEIIDQLRALQTESRMSERESTALARGLESLATDHPHVPSHLDG